MTALTEISSSAFHERSRAIWEQLIAKHLNGPLPFLLLDNAENPKRVLGTWEVTDTGDEVENLIRGVLFAELCVHRARMVKSCGNLDPYHVISEVLLGIVKKGDTGAIARNFIARIAMLALAASLN